MWFQWISGRQRRVGANGKFVVRHSWPELSREVTVMNAPMVFRTRPKALRVLMPVPAETPP